MPHWFYYLLLAMQIAALASLAHGAWRSWKENKELKDGRKHVLYCLDKTDGEGSAKAIVEAYMNAYVIGRANAVVLGVVFALWCLSLLIDITITITKL